MRYLVLSAAGYNLRWLMRAIAHPGWKAVLVLWILLGMLEKRVSQGSVWLPFWHLVEAD